MSRDPKPNDKDYARLGRTLEQVLVQNNLQVTHHWKKFIMLSFVRGLFVGLGSIIGATILVAITLWLLSMFDGLPLIGEWFERLQQSIQDTTDQPF